MPIISTSKEVEMIEIMIQLINIMPVIPSRFLGDDGIIGIPKSLVKASAPAHSKISFCVSIVCGRIK